MQWFAHLVILLTRKDSIRIKGEAIAVFAGHCVEGHLDFYDGDPDSKALFIPGIPISCVDQQKYSCYILLTYLLLLSC